MAFLQLSESFSEVTYKQRKSVKGFNVNPRSQQLLRTVNHDKELSTKSLKIDSLVSSFVQIIKIKNISPDSKQNVKILGS